MTRIPTTHDHLLNRRVALEQPATGYRVAIDTVLLAAAVPATPGEHILDIGCGAGGAMLCVACRVPGITGTGIDIQPNLIDICRRNIAHNAFASGLDCLTADITRLPPHLAGIFDHAFMNPPYHEESSHDPSPNKIKQTAHSEKTGDLAQWIASAAHALKPSGTLTLIHRADRRADILPHLQSAFGEAVLLPVLPKKNAPPKRLIIRARKNAAFSRRNATPLVLHTDTGGYTDEANQILRHSAALIFGDKAL